MLTFRSKLYCWTIVIRNCTQSLHRRHDVNLHLVYQISSLCCCCCFFLLHIRYSEALNYLTVIDVKSEVFLHLQSLSEWRSHGLGTILGNSAPCGIVETMRSVRYESNSVLSYPISSSEQTQQNMIGQALSSVHREICQMWYRLKISAPSSMHRSPSRKTRRFKESCRLYIP